jgi:hypothetical protein
MVICERLTIPEIRSSTCPSQDHDDFSKIPSIPLIGWPKYKYAYIKNENIPEFYILFCLNVEDNNDSVCFWIHKFDRAE